MGNGKAAPRKYYIMRRTYVVYIVHDWVVFCHHQLFGWADHLRHAQQMCDQYQWHRVMFFYFLIYPASKFHLLIKFSLIGSMCYHSSIFQQSVQSATGNQPHVCRPLVTNPMARHSRFNAPLRLTMPAAVQRRGRTPPSAAWHPRHAPNK